MHEFPRQNMHIDDLLLSRVNDCQPLSYAVHMNALLLKRNSTNS